MIESFVLMTIENGKVGEVMDLLKKLKEVKTIASTAGGYDLIIFAKLKDLENLHDFVTFKIQKIDGVKHTETQIIAKKIIK
ncbi:Lrp/AsnC ligand binding domain-containing protein [archaeon]|jgi:DNA-binding Lrp family transcriptional regulator|nr:Lrp/AsnC ligand binding domain-containing protein [archaeon]